MDEHDAVKEIDELLLGYEFGLDKRLNVVNELKKRYEYKEKYEDSDGETVDKCIFCEKYRPTTHLNTCFDCLDKVKDLKDRMIKTHLQDIVDLALMAGKDEDGNKIE